FFFQAEDGIRDRTVTGVQTCALPISLHGLYGSSDIFIPFEPNWQFTSEIQIDLNTITSSLVNNKQSTLAVSINDHPISSFDLVRSEERRVGKECRCGMWRYV